MVLGFSIGESLRFLGINLQQSAMIQNMNKKHPHPQKLTARFAGENRRYLPALFATKKIRGKLLSHDLGNHPLLEKTSPLFTTSLEISYRKLNK